MSEEQLSALLAKLNEDAGLREKLQGVADLDAVVALAKEAGFDVSKADWLKYQEKQTLEPSELSDEELEGVTGGGWLPGYQGDDEPENKNKYLQIKPMTGNCNRRKF